MLTYIIPTHNRSHFLRRALKYYAALGCSRPIHIADSSGPTEKAENRRSVSLYGDRLDLRYAHFDLGVISKCRTMLEGVDTPFTVFSADDDFQVPSAVEKCTEFLAQNRDYTTCSGSSLFATAGNSHYVTARTYRSVESFDVLRRLNRVSLGRYYCLFYAVHRTEDLFRRFQKTDEFTNYESSRILPEVLLLQLMAVSGRIKLIKEVSYVREGHEASDSARLPNFQDLSAFRHNFEAYQQPLTEQLNKLTELSPDGALRVVKQSLVDLVPECFGLFADKEPRRPSQIGQIIRGLRKLREFRLTPAGSKFKISVSTASADDEAIALALKLCREEVPTSAAA